MELSNDNRFIASCDTLKKINVVTWPNVFNMQSVMLEHALAIHYMCFVGPETVASLSEANPANGNQNLFLTSTMDAEVLHSSQVQKVKALA